MPGWGKGDLWDGEGKVWGQQEGDSEGGATSHGHWTHWRPAQGYQRRQQRPRQGSPKERPGSAKERPGYAKVRPGYAKERPGPGFSKGRPVPGPGFSKERPGSGPGYAKERTSFSSGSWVRPHSHHRRRNRNKAVTGKSKRPRPAQVISAAHNIFLSRILIFSCPSRSPRSAGDALLISAVGLGRCVQRNPLLLSSIYTFPRIGHFSSFLPIRVNTYSHDSAHGPPSVVPLKHLSMLCKAALLCNQQQLRAPGGGGRNTDTALV